MSLKTTNLVEWFAMRKQKKNQWSNIELITASIIITHVFINIYSELIKAAIYV